MLKIVVAERMKGQEWWAKLFLHGNSPLYVCSGADLCSGA